MKWKEGHQNVRNNLSDFLVHSLSEEEFLILTTQEGWQNNKNPTERVQNSKLLLSLINCNRQLAGKKVEDLYNDTTVNRVWGIRVWLWLSSCTSFRLNPANILGAKCQHMLGLRNAHHSIRGELSFTLTVLKLNESVLVPLTGCKSLCHH